MNKWASHTRFLRDPTFTLARHLALEHHIARVNTINQENEWYERSIHRTGGSGRPHGGSNEAQGEMHLPLKTAVAVNARFGGGAETGPAVAGMWAQTVEKHLMRGTGGVAARIVLALAKSALFASLLPLGTPLVSVGGDRRPE